MSSRWGEIAWKEASRGKLRRFPKAPRYECAA